MRRIREHATSLSATSHPGAVLCRDLTLKTEQGRVSLRRGTPLIAALERIPDDARDKTELHLLVPDTGDITQEAASELIAERITGNGLQSTEPHQGQVDLKAASNGVLRIDSQTVVQLNESGLVLIATALDGRVVEPDETVAIIKASELLVSRDSLEQILGSAVESVAIEVKPFTRQRVALLAGDRIREQNLNVSSKHLAAGLERFGAELTDVRKIPDDPDGIATTYRELLDAGIELILVAGSIVLDPEDPYLTALDRIDATLVRRGAPIDPGTMFWVARHGEVPFFGLASCEMYGKLSIIDLFLPYALAGETIDNALISRLGYGGLLNDTHVARRPASWRD
jgi:hypothetical protein